MTISNTHICALAFADQAFVNENSLSSITYVLRNSGGAK